MTSEEGVVVADRRVGRSDGHGLLGWGVLGVIAQVAFLAGWLIAETWQGPRYSPVADTISDLQAATAPHVWFPIVCFATGGVGTFCFAVFGLRPALAGAGPTAWYAPWMLGLSALALGNSFPLIPCRLADTGCTAHHQLYSPGGLTDAVVAGTAFLVLAAVPAPLWRRMRLLPQWQPVEPVLTAARVVCPLCFILLSISSVAGVAEGLTERILATSCVLWIGALAVTAIVVSRQPATRPSAGAAGRTRPSRSRPGRSAARRPPRT
jgi:Protein of unknown function (DUF998)